MGNQELREMLEKLHREIERTQTLDEKGQELLRHLGGDIRELLDRSEGESMRPRPATFSQLEDAVSHFEVTHPTLTATMEKLMLILSGAGI
jgi:hypothetical protein